LGKDQDAPNKHRMTNESLEKNILPPKANSIDFFVRAKSSIHYFNPRKIKASEQLFSHVL
jgi:hypothetical protein